MSNHRRTRRFGVGLVGVWALVLTTGALVAAEAPDGGASRAEVPLIQVTGVTRVLPIALPDFKDLSELPDTQETGPKLAEILRGDLSASGYFKVIDPKAYLVKPHEEGVTAAAVRFKDWINVGAQVLVKVGLFVREGRLRMEAHLYEVASARPAWKAPIVLKGDLAEGRMMTHRLANAIIKHYTGVEGVFTTRIAYSQGMRVKGELAKNMYIQDYDGFGRRAVTGNNGLNMFPRFSPDGGHLVYSTSVHGRWEIVRYAVHGAKRKTLTSFPGIALGAAYSPDGKHIAVALSKDGNAEIYLLHAGGGVIRKLTNHWGIDTSATWSPDGSRIAFVSDRSGTPQLYVMGRDGGDTKRLTFRGNYNQEPDWSPKGNEIVFTARDERAKFDLFVVDVADGQKVNRLTQDEGQHESARWAPDGRQIIFTSTRGGASRLYFMITETRETRPVPGGRSGVYTPAWSPRAQ